MNNKNTFIFFFVLLTYSCNNANNKDNDVQTVVKNSAENIAIVLEYNNDTLITLSTAEYDSIIQNELVEIPQHGKSHPEIGRAHV